MNVRGAGISNVSTLFGKSNFEDSLNCQNFPLVSFSTARCLNREFEILLSLVCEGIDIFKNYDTQKILVSVGRSVSKGRWGVWAHVGPLKSRPLWGQIETSPKVYLMTFLFPRFFELSEQERLETIVHELYHLHPSLDGRLRTFARPHVFHGPTPGAYRRRVHELSCEAIKKIPQILSHPLLKGKAQDFEGHDYERFSRTSRNTLPSKPKNKMKLGRWLQFFCSLFLIFNSHASWAQDSGSLNSNKTDKTVNQKETPIPPDPTAQFFASKDSKFFGGPSRFSERYGIIQQGDEIIPLALSQGLGWTRIRLLLTGEEGWYPSSWITRVDKKIAQVAGPSTFSLGIGWASAGYGGQGGLAYSYNFLESAAVSKSGENLQPVERFELGPEFQFFSVSDFNRIDRKILSQAWMVGFLSRYAFQNPESDFLYEITAGVHFHRKTLMSEGITQEVLIASGLNPSESGLGFSAGLGLFYQASQFFFLGLRVRAMKLPDFVWVSQGVIDVRF